MALTKKKIGLLFKRPTTKTAFKVLSYHQKGRCIGQVSVDGWFFWFVGDPLHVETGRSEGCAGGPRWTKIAEALAAMEAEYLKRQAGSEPNGG